MKIDKYPKVIDPKTRKWQRYYRKGKCVICSQKTEVSKTSSTAWCCSPCLELIEANGRKSQSANLFGR
jgi:ribosomal protein L37AE/L43A